MPEALGAGSNHEREELPPHRADIPVDEQMVHKSARSNCDHFYEANQQSDTIGKELGGGIFLMERLRGLSKD